MLGLLLITLLFVGVLFGMDKFMDYKKIKENWAEYRCRPDVMLFADMYGHNSTENMEFCLKNGFDTRAMSFMKPFFTFMASFVAILATMLENLNSIRMIFATIIGTVTQVFREFAGRMTALVYRIQYTAIRMRMLMGRVFGMMYAIIFMGMSGIKAGQNFSNTFLFSFLDTFCFDPDTPIEVKERGRIPIKDVKIGDVLEDGQRVTSTFSFFADGQPMVTLPGQILVSTNHYILHEDKWVLAKDHPHAVPTDPWSGHTQRPLICLNTSSHTFKLGAYIFRDYDETQEGDREAMCEVLRMLNGKRPEEEEIGRNSDMAVEPSTMIKTKTKGTVPAGQISLGQELSTGTVLGIVKKEIHDCYAYRGTLFAPGTCVWDPVQNAWRRAERVGTRFALAQPQTYVSFIVSPGASLETQSGILFRDYMEVHDPSLEEPYAAELKRQSEHLVKAEC